MMSARRGRSLILLFVLLALQVSLFAHLRPFGIAPDLLLTAALVGGIFGGPDYGARNGFVAGLALDLVVPGAFGLAAGIYGIFGFGVGTVARALDPSDPRVLPVLVGISAFLATGTYGLALGVLGSEQFVNEALLSTALGVAIGSVLLAGFLRRGYVWVFGTSGVARTENGPAVVN